MIRESRCQDWLDPASIERLAGQSPTRTAVVIGDVALDAWWFCDMRQSELSLETPFPTRPVVRERYGCGAAANVAVQLRALGIGRVYLLSVIGQDWRAGLLRELLQAEGIETSALIASAARVTPAYIKPMLQGYPEVAYSEVERMDFQSSEALSEALEAQVSERLEALSAEADVVVVSDQYRSGCLTPGLRAQLSTLRERRGLPVLVDSRHHLAAYRHVYATPNVYEALASSGCDEAQAAGAALRALLDHDLAVTHGAAGAVAYHGDAIHAVRPPQLPPVLDSVGAGDCFAAALATSWALSGQATPGLPDVAFATLVASLSTLQRGTGRIDLEQAARVIGGGEP